MGNRPPGGGLLCARDGGLRLKGRERADSVSNRRDGKGAQHRTRKSWESAPRQGTRGKRRAMETEGPGDRALDGRAHARVFLHEARVVVLGVERPRRPVEREARARGVELLRRDGAARRRVPERRNAPRGAGSVRGAQADERRRARRVERQDGRAPGGGRHRSSIDEPVGQFDAVVCRRLPR